MVDRHAQKKIKDIPPAEHVPARPAIVLVEPKGARNIGSIARVMMNFGFDDLRLVAPRCDHLGKEARDMAVSAESILERARLHDNLSDAISECNLVFGTTRRFGKYRQEFLFPHEAGPRCGHPAHHPRTALLFGREDHGLTTAELDRCHFLLTVPTDEKLPSMNIAQSVTVCLYELHSYYERQGVERKKARVPASADDLEIMFRHMRGTLTDIGFLHPQNPDHILRTFRRIFGRALIDDREVRVLHGLWRKIAWLHAEYLAAKKKS